MSTRAEILNGALFEGYEDFCADVVNAIITHYRVSDPCVNMVARQPGEILSDPDDDKLHHVGGASGYPCDEILQAARSCDVIPEFKGVDFYDVCNGDYATIRGINEPGLGHRLTIGLDETTRTMVICDLGDIAVDFGLAAVAHPTLYIKSASNADHLFMYHDDTDAYFRTNDGSFIFQTDEGVNTETFVVIRGKGTQEGYLQIYDEDDSVYIQVWAAQNTGRITTYSGSLDLQFSISQDIRCWPAIGSGNPSLIISGWNTAGGDLESTELTMDDVNDEFLIQTANSVNHEGITVSLLEANQKFRVRGAAAALRFYVKSDGEIGTNQTAAATTLGNVTDRLPIYDESQNLVGYIPIYDAIT